MNIKHVLLLPINGPHIIIISILIEWDILFNLCRLTSEFRFIVFLAYYLFLNLLVYNNDVFRLYIGSYAAELSFNDQANQYAILVMRVYVMLNIYKYSECWRPTMPTMTTSSSHKSPFY